MSEQILERQLSWKDGTKEYVENFLEKVSNYKKIIIFGAGIGGAQTYELLAENSMDERVEAFSDNNKDKIGKKYFNCSIIAPQFIKEDRLVIVSSTAYKEVRKQLVNIGVKKENIYFFQPAGMIIDNNDDKLFVQHNIGKFEEVYNSLADAKSKKILLLLLNYRITKNSNWLDELEKYSDLEENQYFNIDILKRYKFSEGFLDASAYDGDTVANLYTKLKSWKGTCYCFEASTRVFERLKNRIEKLQVKDIEAYNYAVWDKNEKLRFDSDTYGDGAGSRVSDKGELVQAIALDDILENKKIDFIKMDVEGAEKKALIGAKEIIKKNNPILAICIYHRQEDYYDILFTIREIVSDAYDYYIRQYRYGISETVLYAMPKCRRI